MNGRAFQGATAAHRASVLDRPPECRPPNRGTGSLNQELRFSQVVERVTRSEEIDMSEGSGTQILLGPAFRSRLRRDARPRSALLEASLLAVWGLAIVAGCLVLQVYANRPGDAGQSARCGPETAPYRSTAADRLY